MAACGSSTPIVLSASLGLSPYEAADLAASIRRQLVVQQESFIFETVLSDPLGEKVDQLAPTRRTDTRLSLSSFE